MVAQTFYRLYPAKAREGDTRKKRVWQKIGKKKRSAIILVSFPNLPNPLFWGLFLVTLVAPPLPVSFDTQAPPLLRFCSFLPLPVPFIVPFLCVLAQLTLSRGQAVLSSPTFYPAIPASPHTHRRSPLNPVQRPRGFFRRRLEQKRVGTVYLLSEITCAPFKDASGQGDSCEVTLFLASKTRPLSPPFFFIVSLLFSFFNKLVRLYGVGVSGCCFMLFPSLSHSPSSYPVPLSLSPVDRPPQEPADNSRSRRKSQFSPNGRQTAVGPIDDCPPLSAAASISGCRSLLSLLLFSSPCARSRRGANRLSARTATQLSTSARAVPASICCASRLSVRLVFLLLLPLLVSRFAFRLHRYASHVIPTKLRWSCLLPTRLASVGFTLPRIAYTLSTCCALSICPPSAYSPARRAFSAVCMLQTVLLTPKL